MDAMGGCTNCLVDRDVSKHCVAPAQGPKQHVHCAWGMLVCQSTSVVVPHHNALFLLGPKSWTALMIG
jgi:hypothetical protein